MRILKNVLMIANGMLLAILIKTDTLSVLGVTGILLAIATAMSLRSLLSMKRKTDTLMKSQGHNYRTNHDVDVSAENRLPPPALQPAIIELSNWGFRRLGEIATVTIKDTEIACTWVYVHESEQVLAGLVPSRGIAGGVICGFETIFPNYAWVTTMYPSGFPVGETITLPNFRFRHTMRSLSDAYTLHQTEQVDFGQQHGEPVSLHTLADYLAFSDVFRERYTYLTLRRGQQIIKLQPYFWGTLILLFLFGTLLSYIIPAMAVVIFVLGFTVLGLYLSYTMPTHWRAKRWYRWVLALALLLVPVSITWHWFILVHMLGLSLLLTIFSRFVPADSKALAKEIEQGKTDVNWQV